MLEMIRYEGDPPSFSLLRLGRIEARLQSMARGEE